MAADYAGRLRSLGDVVLRVEHIGSTAVAGLIAKPVVDMLVVVTTLAALDARQGDVVSLGMVWHGEFGVDGRRFCTLDSDAGDSDARVRLANVHFYAADSRHPARQIAFRDYLRSHPDVAAAYGVEKQRAAKIQPDDSTAYSAEKGDWIRSVELAALDWSVGAGRSA